MKRLIGLDYGESKVGVAVSDPLGLTAQGLETLYDAGWRDLIKRVSRISDEYETNEIVLGLPYTMNGTVGPQAQAVMEFGERLEAEGFCVHYWDERLSTAVVRRVLIEGGIRRDKRKKVIDKLAAVTILQNYLDANSASDIHTEPGTAVNEITGGADMDMDNIVELVDEDGQSVEFEHLQTIEYRGQPYVLLTAVEPSDDLGEDEVLILRIETDESGEEMYSSVDDEEIEEAVFQIYVDMVEDEDDLDEGAEEDDSGDEPE
jgi:putative Holliday junction resolvase